VVELSSVVAYTTLVKAPEEYAREVVVTLR
jgi:hypothetical protein